MKLKILFISFILSIPFWWGVNIFAKGTERLFYDLALAQKPELLTAEINKVFLDREVDKLKLIRQRMINLDRAGVNSRAAIIVETAKNGEEKILFSLNSQDRLAIASLTKLMTALIVFDLKETYNLNQLITINQKAVQQEGESKYGNLIAGEKLSVKELLRIMLIESSNDAAFALTQPIGQEAFVDLMNIYTQKIGMKDTYFINSTGLEPDNPEEVKNYSSAEDLTKLIKYIFNNYPELFTISIKESYRVLRPDGSLHHFIAENTNKLLSDSADWRLGIIGGKTGSTPGAGECLIIVWRDNKTNDYFINIVLGANDRFEEMRKIMSALQI